MYAEDLRVVDADEAKIVAARELIDDLVTAGIEPVVPVQVLAELHNALRRKLCLATTEANERTLRLAGLCRIVPTDAEIFALATGLVTAAKLQTYDAIILSAAANAGCEVLYSEDLQHGFSWNGVKVIDPFR